MTKIGAPSSSTPKYLFLSVSKSKVSSPSSTPLAYKPAPKALSWFVAKTDSLSF